MNQYVMPPISVWASQNLSQAVEIKLKGKSLFAKILLTFCFGFLALIFLGIPLLLYISGDITRGTVFLVIYGAFALGIFLLIRFTRQKIARVLSLQGVETRDGQKFEWERLKFLNYKRVSTKVSSRNFAMNATSALILAGVEKITVEMVFENGEAVVPPLIENQPQILALLDSMPVERRDEGKIRQ